VEIDTGDWNTITTKQTINEALGKHWIRVFSDRGQMYAVIPGITGDVPFDRTLTVKRDQWAGHTEHASSHHYTGYTTDSDKPKRYRYWMDNQAPLPLIAAWLAKKYLVTNGEIEPNIKISWAGLGRGSIMTPEYAISLLTKAGYVIEPKPHKPRSRRKPA